MPSRIKLYVTSVRNRVGRKLGVASAYTPDQLATARTLWTCGKAMLWDDDTCASFLGNVEGECSFLLHIWGDRNTAVDILQHHKNRRDIIKTYTGIDMETADATDQFKGVYWELTSKPSAYRLDMDLIKAAVGIPAKIAVWVSKVEQSGSQARDIVRRTANAQYWLNRATQENWNAAPAA